MLSGAAAAFARKAAGLHSRAGLVYWWGLLWIFISSIVMAVLRWPHDIHLVIIGAVAFGAGTSGFLARLRRWTRWRELHIVSMGLSYVALLTGFYVDNGPHLPVWRHLPRWMFWILPLAVGAPLIARSIVTERRRRVAQ